MTGYGPLFAAALGLLAVSAVADLLASGRKAGGDGVPSPRAYACLAGPYLLGALSSACLTMVGAASLAGHQVRLGAQGWLGQGTAGLEADRLSGLFLVIAFGAALPVSLAFADWAARGGASGRRGLGASYALTLAAVAVVMTATDAFTLLFGWELLTVGFYLLAGFERHRTGRASGALVTVIFGKISGAALLAGLLLLAARAGSLRLASFALVPGGAARATALALLIAGFAIKVGLVPFQVWLPRGYAAAPGPARAIMAGVAVNVGFYGLWRALAVLGAPPAWLTGLLLVLAGLTALLGIAHAAVQPGLQRVIAYSSVENAGLILAGYGVALTGVAVRDELLAAAGLLAATLQVIAHAAAKSLLFTASAVIAPAGGSGVAGGAGVADGNGRGTEAPGDDDLDALRGVARRLPWSGTALAIGSLTLAGLPLTAGFASEWFLLEALMQQFRVPVLGFRLVLAIAGAAVALTAGFAGVTFVRLTGLVVLGPAVRAVPAGPVVPAAADGAAGTQSHGDEPGAGREYGTLGLAAIVILSAGCLGIAALLPLVIRAVAAGLAPVVPAPVTSGALKSPWVVQPVFAGFSILSPTWLWVVMPLLALVAIAVAWLASGTRLVRVRRVPAWRSATAGVEGADCYTATGFANPTRRVLATVLHSTSQVRPLAASAAEPGVTVRASAGPVGGRASTEPTPPAEIAEAAAPVAAPGRAARLGYTADVIELVEAYLYRPALRPVMALVAMAKRLQSGRLEAYLAYMLIALVALIALVTALA